MLCCVHHAEATGGSPALMRTALLITGGGETGSLLPPGDKMRRTRPPLSLLRGRPRLPSGVAAAAAVLLVLGSASPVLAAGPASLSTSSPGRHHYICPCTERPVRHFGQRVPLDHRPEWRANGGRRAQIRSHQRRARRGVRRRLHGGVHVDSPRGSGPGCQRPPAWRNWGWEVGMGAKFAYVKATEGDYYLSPAFSSQFNNS